MFGSQGRKLRRVEILILRLNWIYLSDEFFSLILRAFLSIQLNKMSYILSNKNGRLLLKS